MMVPQFDVCVLVLFMVLTWLPHSIFSQHNQPPHGQQAHQAGHGHGHHAKPLEFASEIHNADHILEHLQKVVSTKTKEQMSEEELEFHYFKLHDYDNNNKLDGVEIGKALTHIHEDSEDVEGQRRSTRAYSDQEMAEVIDAALLSDDLDGDGYVEYPEFMAAQARRSDLELSQDDMELAPREEIRAPGHQHEHAPQPPGF